MAVDQFISVVSPATGKEVIFRWQPSKASEIKEENSEIVDVIGWIAEDVDELSDDHELHTLLAEVDRTNYDSVFKLSAAYNSAILDKISEWDKCGTKPSFLSRRASVAHLQFILYQCYNRAVAEPDKLNQYPPFSPQVYGETSFELICQMINTINISSDDTFIDLGSGVGQVVLQVAASTDAKFCYGIEKAEYPALCARRLDSEFRSWMAFYGKSYRPYLLERGDFLSPECQERISSAGVLFANNFAFGPEVDHQLKQRFANLKEGARIISSKAFCPLNFRITDRNLGDIGSIMHVYCLNPIQDAVSWTDKPFSYYVHTIDRSLLERYFSRLKNPKQKDDIDVVRRDRKGRVISDTALKDAPVVVNGVDPHRPSKHGISQKINGRRRSHSASAAHRNCHATSLSISAAKKSSQARSSCNLRCKSHRSTNGRSNSSFTLQRHPLFSRRKSRRSSSVLVVDQTHAEWEPRKCVRHVNGSVSYRLASLALGPNDNTDLLLRSSSFPTLNGCLTSTSGQTTPTGSTSISSAAFSADDGPTFEADKQSLSMQLPTSSEHGAYSPPTDTHAYPISGYRNSAAGWASSSSSFGSSLSASSMTNRSPVPSTEETLVPSTFELSLNSPVVNPAECTTIPIPVRQSLNFSSNSFTSNPEASVTDIELSLTPPADDSEADSSVAKRRAVRKCRQLAQSNTSGIVSPNNASKRARQISNARVRTAPNRFCSLQQPTFPDEVKADLEVLHEETVVQVGALPGSLHATCNDPAMSSFTCHYGPRELYSLDQMKRHGEGTSSDPHIGHSEEPVPLALTQYLELSKRAFMEYFTLMRTPAYECHVRQQLTEEQARHAHLMERIRLTEQSISKLHAEGTDLLKRFTRRLGIHISTPSAFFAQARKLIKHHHVLEGKITEFRKQISELSAANQELVRRHQVEAARLLSTALHHTAGAHMPSSNQAKLNHCVSQSARQKLKRPKGTVSPAVVTSATPVIPPPPSLTKTDPAHSAAAHAPDVFTHTHKFARRRRSIPLLLPQPPSIPCSPSSPSRSPSETPPVLRRLDENIDVVPIPPPPPLLPMHNPCSSTLDVPYVMHFSTSSSAASSNSGNSPLLQRTHSQFHDSHSLVFHPQMRSKSMHASLQDLIAEEFSKQSSYSGEYITMCPSRALPDQPKLATSSLVHQLTLPPRKRIWNLNDAEKPVSSPKHSRQDSPKFAQLSPPTLSPIEPKSSLTSRSSCNGLSTAFSCDASDALNMPPPPLVPTSEEWHRSNPPLLQDQPTLPSISLVVAPSLSR